MLGYIFIPWKDNDSINDHDIINLNKTYTINLLETEAERTIRTRTVVS